ncbi:GIY-YIG nuclease family protein [Paenibacillus chitinolyticus]|uniref:GIY-YIG nuclease family protein n=1 Tax=Paenibacillus chitinolyticus TaxID=79263 RepID=UPI00365CF780
MYKRCIDISDHLNLEPNMIVTINNLKQAPKISGVYKIYNSNKELMYIGQSNNLRRRLTQHFREKRKDFFISEVHLIYIYHEHDFILSSLLDYFETEFIKALKPKHNKHKKSPTRFLIE